MNLKFLSWGSLKTRVTLFTLVIFLIGIWSLSFYASHVLHEDLERVLGEQQFSTVSFMAAEINDELNDRIEGLGKVAEGVTRVIHDNALTVQNLQAQRPLFQSLFNGGVVACRIDGSVIAQIPHSVGRIGFNYLDRDAVAAALKEGKSMIGQPFIDPESQAPVIIMAVPIRDPQGNVSGALIGVTELGKPNFLDKVTENRYGKTGGYLLIAPQYRLIITASDKRRIMEALPAPGVNPLLDRFMQGYEGTEMMVNRFGMEELASAKAIPLARWYTLAVLPTEEAYAPIYDLHLRMLAATIFLTVLAGILTWWMLRRQLSPMLAAVKTLAALSDRNQPPQPLPITTRDEIGHLIGGFNRLLEVLAQREDALRESEFRWKFAIEGSGHGVWDWDLQTDKANYSERWKEMLGYAGSDILSSNQEWVSRIHPEDQNHVAEAMQDYLDGKSPTYVVEHRLRCKDGSYKWILGRGMVVSRNEDGKPLRMIGTHTDITQRKQAQKFEQFRGHILELLAGDELFDSILEAIVSGVEQLNPEMLCSILLLDSEGRYLCGSVAPSPPDFCNAAIDGNEIDKGDESCGTAAPAGERVIVEDISTHPDWAPYRELAASAGLGLCWSAPIRSSVGQLLGAFAIYHQEAHTPSEFDLDLIEQSARLASIAIESNVAKLELNRHREHLEELVQQQTAGLQRNVAMTKLALTELEQQKFVLDQHAIVSMTDTAGRITYGNDKFSEISGYSRGEFMGRDHRLINSGHHPKEFFKAMYETINRGEVWHAEVCSRAKGGHLFWTDTTIAAFMGEDGKPREYIAVRTDITERKRIEEAAQAANTAKSEFLANMSHEIRTPMNGVVGMVDILQQTELTAAQQRMVDTIHDSSLALLRILNDILDFSKIEAGKLTIESIPTHLREVAEGVAQLMATISAAKSIELSVFVAPDLPHWVLLDPSRLRQVLLNLLGNAVKFTTSQEGRSGRVMLSVEPCTLPEGCPGIQLRIIDNGIGMSPEALAKLFQPFTQADESTARKYGGTGLGLSISQRLLDMMGGRITVRSTLGEGSEFAVELPLQEAAPGRVLAAEPSLTGVQVLVVTRDASVARIVPAYCIAAGAEVTVVADLASARRYLTSEQHAVAPTVVVLDDAITAPTNELDLPQTVRVVRLIGRCSAGNFNELSVSARPMLYLDLIRGVALASGRLLLPGNPDQTERRRTRVRTPAPSVEEAARTGRLILLAEDNATNREVMREQLRILGYAAEMAEDGVAALAMWRTGRYALLLTDCHMPNMDGFELTAAIRQSEAKGTHLPIIAVTANAMQGESERCGERGMDDYLSKPLRLDELGPMLARWLPLPVDMAEEFAGADQKIKAERFAESQIEEVIASRTDTTGHPPVQSVLWDAMALTRNLGNNAAMHSRLLERFLSDAQQLIDVIGVASAAGETRMVASEAHKLKSSANTVGAVQLGEICQKMENAGRADDERTCSAYAGSLHLAFSAVAKRIRESLA
ncbi:MAG: PAS domain-containing protein [Betaproteobacteria bacterium]|nr:PAS domain-containing protein [Betaproteobacteria bacterium]